jgi:hypothetical protein
VIGYIHQMCRMSVKFQRKYTGRWIIGGLSLGFSRFANCLQDLSLGHIRENSKNNIPKVNHIDLFYVLH